MVTAYVLVAVVFISGSVLLNGFLYRYAENISGQSRSANHAVYSDGCLGDGETKASYRTAAVLGVATPTTLARGTYTTVPLRVDDEASESDWRADFNSDGDRDDIVTSVNFELVADLDVESVAVVAVHHAGICWQIISPDE